jgi:Protein of unknown function (DUF4199)
MEQESTTEQPSIFQHAIKWGVIMGGIGIALTILFYAVDYTMLADWKTGILIFLVLIGFTTFAGINYRTQAGGFLSYGEAFKHGFILMAISGIVSTLFMILMYTVIDTELPQKLMDATMEKTQAMMEGFGVPEDQMDKAMEDAKKRTEGQFSAFGAVKSYGFGLILYAIFSLITSIFVKKNQPVEF